VLNGPLDNIENNGLHMGHLRNIENNGLHMGHLRNRKQWSSHGPLEEYNWV